MIAVLLPLLIAMPGAAGDPAGGVAASAVADASADPAIAAARAYRRAHGAEILRDFAELLAMPNVAANLDDVESNAAAIGRRLEARGTDVELWRLDGVPPIVYGRLAAAGAERTLGIYVHYDGQPVDAEEWADPPWQPTLRSAALEDGGERLEWPEDGAEIDPEWRLYARSSGDDKAPLPALFAALDALREAGIERTSNLVFLFEGEEEAGSPNLRRYLEKYGDRLADVDLWLICDGPVHPSRRPQLVFGVRGVSGLEITVYGARRYLHSGHYGNWAPNPALLLAQLLASMKDGDGRVLIDGFYDSTLPVSDAERRVIDALPPQDEALRRDLGLAESEAGNAPLAERILLPSLNVRGFDSGEVGDAARNVIPNRATASLDVRLVRGNDPEAMLDLVEAHVRRQGYHVVRDEPDLETRLAHPKIARIERQPGYPAARTSMELPIIERVIAAGRRAAGEELVLMPTLGGSLPLYLWGEMLGQPLVITPIANHDNNQHAPNENLRLANLWYGVDLMAALLTMD